MQKNAKEVAAQLRQAAAAMRKQAAALRSAPEAPTRTVYTVNRNDLLRAMYAR